MLHRNIRLRKEYLYRKSLEGKQQEEYEKKLKIKEALNEGKRLPADLRNEVKTKDRLDLDDDNTVIPRTHIDDEYSHAGEIDPKICLTTSRTASSKLVQFGKELTLLIPNVERINRGNMNLTEIIESCRRHDFTDVIFIHEHRGVPDGLIISHLPYGPTAYFGVFNTVLRHDIGSKKDIGTTSAVYPHLIFDNLTTKLGERFQSILKYLFPVPTVTSKRIVTFANRNEFISVRNHLYMQPKGAESIELTEVQH
eukprot:g5913.t1